MKSINHIQKRKGTLLKISKCLIHSNWESDFQSQKCAAQSCPQAKGRGIASLFIQCAFLLFLLLIVISTTSFSTTALNIQSVQITNSNVTTIVDLVCRFNITGTGTLSANYTWYNGLNNVLEGTVTGITSGEYKTTTLPHSYTAKGETWKCGIIAINETTNTSQTNSTGVTINNSLPIITFPVIKQVVYEDILFQITATATDPDGDPIDRWLSDDLNASLYPNDGLSNIINRNTGVITILVDYDQVGNHTVSLFARDGSEWGGRDVVFEVLPTNDPPIFTNLADQKATQGEKFIYTLSATDQDNSSLIFSYYSENTNITMVANTPLSVNFSFAGVKNAPSFGDRGNWTVYVNASDGLNITQGSFVIEVISVNTPPVLEFIPMYNATQGENLTFYINASDPDTGQELMFSVNNSLYKLTTIQNTSSNAIALINITPLNNSHVIHRNITITVFDGQDTDSQSIFLNITNTNDAPIIYNRSYYSNNTNPNIYTYNLIAYAGAPFRYIVNATDPDMMTYEGDSITFSSNDSNFSIHSTTGMINFTKNESWVGNHSVNITVTDSHGNSTSETIRIEIQNNTIPYFTHSFPNMLCPEDYLCVFDINATDDDGDSINYTSNSTLFKINNETGLISFTPNQSVIGNYSIKITVQDSKGAVAHGYFNLSINNTNDAPVIYTTSLPRMVEDHFFTYTIFADDEDLNLTPELQYDYLTFSAFNITNISVFNISTAGVIAFTPNSTHVGNHSYNITVTDSYGLMDSVIINFTVYPRSEPPTINLIYPYGSPVSNNTIVYAWRSRADFPNSYTFMVNITENKTLTFSHNTTDDKTAFENLTYKWYFNGVHVTDPTNLTPNNHTFTRYFDFFSSGNHSVKLYVFDDMYENSSFTWNFTITNLNRPPKMYNPPSNLTIDQTTTIPYYFSYDYDTIIIDPDDDLNSNGKLDRGIGETEINRLTYSITGCSSHATLEVLNTDTLRVVPKAVGVCFAVVNATDPEGLSVTSGLVLINITEIPEQEKVTVQSGGGGSSTQTITIPIPEEVEVPFPLEVVIPNIIAIYENETIVIPVRIKNNWDSTLYGIYLNAVFNTTYNMSYYFEKSFFSEISPLSIVDTSLTVSGYRFGENFEIKVVANVTEPVYNDSATVLINSLEKRSKGEQVQIKVTYARDLLDNNPECQELNEILYKAIERVNQRDWERAEELINGVIEGCKYLVQRQLEKKQNKEIPKNWKTFFLFGNEYPTMGLIIVAIILLSLIILGIFSRAKKMKKQKVEGKKIDY